jgi:hypothetical protein
MYRFPRTGFERISLEPLPADALGRGQKNFGDAVLFGCSPGAAVQWIKM